MSHEKTSTKVQSGVILYFLDLNLAAVFKAGAEIAKHNVPILATNAAKYFVKKIINELNIKFL